MVEDEGVPGEAVEGEGAGAFRVAPGLDVSLSLGDIDRGDHVAPGVPVGFRVGVELPEQADVEPGLLLAFPQSGFDEDTARRSRERAGQQPAPEARK